MYRAKQAGKGRVELYAPQMQAEVVRRAELAARLRTALHDGEFTLLHQPVVELATGRSPPSRHRPAGAPPRASSSPPPSSCAGRGGGHATAPRSWAAGCWRRPSSRPRLRHGAGPRGPGRRPALRPPAAGPGDAARPASSPCSPGTACPRAALCWSCPTTTPGSPLDELERGWSALRRLGVRIALDGFGSGYAAISALRRLPVDVLQAGPRAGRRAWWSPPGCTRSPRAAADRRRPRHAVRRGRRRPARAGPRAARHGLYARPGHGLLRAARRAPAAAVPDARRATRCPGRPRSLSRRRCRCGTRTLRTCASAMRSNTETPVPPT